MTKNNFTSSFFKSDKHQETWVELVASAYEAAAATNHKLDKNVAAIITNSVDSFIALEESFPEKYEINVHSSEVIKQLVQERINYAPHDHKFGKNYIRQILDSGMEDSAVAVMEAGRRAAAADFKKRNI